MASDAYRPQRLRAAVPAAVKFFSCQSLIQFSRIGTSARDWDYTAD